ncbi:MAG: penicillin-binding transpeptidase domain-containing protein [Pseudomonadota bacterium]
MSRTKRVFHVGLIVLPAAALFVLLLFGASSLGKIIHSSKAEAAQSDGAKEGADDGPVNPMPAEVMAAMDIEKAGIEGGRLVQTLEDGTKITYTLKSKLQKRAEAVLEKSGVLAGALVLLDVETGEVLAMAEHRGSEYTETAAPIYLSALPPAASLFKIVTATALLEKKAADARTEVCYHGGLRKLDQSDLEDNPERDQTCASLGLAVGKSLNTVFAKLADRSLTASELESAGKRYGFGEQIPLHYAMQPQVSRMDIPSERLEFARAAAGFWHVTISPLHAAMLAQGVAAGGKMLAPTVVERIEDARGEPLWTPIPMEWMQCAREADTEQLRDMMIETVARGTAKKHFEDHAGRPFIPGIEIAGKTGSLAQKSPYRFYSWFIGFAPADEPKVAVASLAVNGQAWKMKGGMLAMELLRTYFWKPKSKNKPEADSNELVGPPAPPPPSD